MHTLSTFCYLDDYEPFNVVGAKKRSSDISLSDLERHVRLYSLADRLIVPSLKACALQKFTDGIATWNNVASRATVATSGIVKLLYTTAPPSDRGMRNTLCEYLKNDVKKLLRDENFVHVLETTEGFAIELFKLFAIGSCV